MGRSVWGRVARYAAMLCCVFPATLALTADRDFQMTVEPVFIGTPPGSDLPLVVTVKNTGKEDAEGDVIVRAEGFYMRYPVQLPRGSTKRLTAYIHGLRNFESIAI